MVTKLGALWHLRADGLMHNYRTGATMTPGTVDPPPGGGGGGGGMLMGVPEWAEIYDSDAIHATLKAANPAATIRCIRRYEDAVPANWANCRGTRDVGKGRATWLSFTGDSIATILAGGAYDTRLASFFASVPPTHRLLYTPINEVDNGKLGGNTPAQYGIAMGRVYDIKQASAVNPSNILIGPTITSQQYRNNVHAAYYPTNGHYDFVGVDGYRFWREPGSPPDIDKLGGTPGGWGRDRPLSWIFGNLPGFAQDQGKQVCVGEYAAHPRTIDVTDRPRFLQASDDFLKSIGCTVACYFHSTAGPSGPWQVDRWHYSVGGKTFGDPDPASTQAYADIVAANYTGGLT